MSDEGNKRRRRRRPRRRPKTGDPPSTQGQDGDAPRPDGAQGQGQGQRPVQAARSEPDPREEANKRRRRRRPRRRPKAGAPTSAQPEGGAEPPSSQGQRPAQGGKGRPRSRVKAKAASRRPRRTRKLGNWWARRWSSSLDGIHVGRRVGHGRTYARQGRVIELELEKGAATAMVQGSRDAPYLVRMHFGLLSAADWKQVLRALGEDIELGGGLFRGEFPPGAEEAFTGLELSLFPSGQGDLKAACSCPDQANPCKHVAAVFYALGEEIDRDPFLLFRLRGLDRAELMEALARTPAARAAIVPPPTSAEVQARVRDAVVSSSVDPSAGSGSGEGEDRPPRQEPLPLDPLLFWAGREGRRDPEFHREVRIPRGSGALARRLGGYPFWKGENGCSAVLDQIYGASSQMGLSLYLGESDPDNTDER